MINLAVLCDELNNYFVVERIFGDFDISQASFPEIDKVQDSQYFRIVGSLLNDGVYQKVDGSVEGLVDEKFNGAIWLMAVPKDVLVLLDEINSWVDSYKQILDSPYTSESFGGYSYSKSGGNSGGGIDWQTKFRSRLNKWRKIACRY